MTESQLPPREKIINVAGDLFHSQGFGSVTVDAIIEKSGLSASTFHRTFENKDAVAIAWLQRLNRRMGVVHNNFLEKPGPKEQRLKKYFLSMAGWVETNNYRSCQFANMAAAIDSSHEELTQAVDQYKRAHLKFFISLVGSIVGPKEAQRIGTAVYLLYSGAMTEAQNIKAKWPLQDALTCAEELCGIPSSK